MGVLCAVHVRDRLRDRAAVLPRAASRRGDSARAHAVLLRLSLAAALAAAAVFKLGLGTAAGAYSGGLTQSAAIGTSIDAIGRLPIDAELKRRLAADVTVGYAVTYIAGLVASVWSVAWLAPRLLRVDLAAECRELEAELGVGRADAGVVSAYRAFVTRA